MSTEPRAHGRRMASYSYPLCGTRTDAPLWSLADSGRRRPGCRALHTFHPAVSTRDVPPAATGD